MRKRVIMDAFEAYQRREPLSGERLMDLVRKFAYVKVYHLENEFKDFGTDKTADDWAQEVARKVWPNLKRIAATETPEGFYAWLRASAVNNEKDALKYLRKQSRTKVPLFVAHGEDDEGDPMFDENPVINSLPAWRDAAISLPASITGTDRAICRLILDGCNYAEVADVIGSTVDAVENRVRRIRKQFAAEKDAGAGASYEEKEEMTA